MESNLSAFLKMKRRFEDGLLSTYVAVVLGAVAMFVLLVFFRASDFDKLLVEICTLIAAVCAFVGWRRQLGKRAEVILSAILAVLLVCSFWGPASNNFSHLGERKQMNNWVMYHHYLGVKYFDELGYTGLYEQTLAADAETGRRLEKIDKIRNLSTYQREKIGPIDDFKRSDRFTDERWEEFKSDVNYFISVRDLRFWKRVLRDRGYNCSPTWNFFATILFKTFPLQDLSAQTFLVLLDIFLVLAAFGVSVRAYGWARSLLVLCSFYMWFGNSHDFGSVYLLDWFAASWAGVSAWRLGWTRTSGALLAYATMVRIFPAALFLGPIVHAGVRLIRQRRFETRYRRFFVSAFLCAALLFVVGGVHTRYGFGFWKMFASEITFHRRHHIEGARRIGLEHIFTIDFSKGWPQQLSKENSLQTSEKNKPFFRVVQLGMLALLLISIFRADEHDALLLGAALVFIGTIASRYYGTVFLLLLFLGYRRRGDPSGESQGEPSGPDTAALLLDSFLFLLILAVRVADTSGVDRYPAYLFANALLSVWFTALLAKWAFKKIKDPVFKRN